MGGEIKSKKKTLNRPTLTHTLQKKGSKTGKKFWGMIARRESGGRSIREARQGGQQRGGRRAKLVSSPNFLVAPGWLVEETFPILKRDCSGVK